jgi:acyl-CoA thioesterase-1
MTMGPAQRGVTWAALFLAMAAACSSSRSDVPAARADDGTALPAPARAQPAAEPIPARPRIVCLGDSLTAGYGLPSTDEAYPALLEKRLRSEGYQLDVINAGVSGDTSAGGLRRLDWSLRGDVRVLIIALGGNDGLRGLPPSELRGNLGAIIKTAQARHMRVLLLGMEAPPNFGARYTHDFRMVYAELARQFGVPLVPFFLNGVAGISGLNQADGIHPTAEGQRRIAETIWPALQRLVKADVTS